MRTVTQIDREVTTSTKKRFLVKGHRTVTVTDGGRISVVASFKIISVNG